MILIVSGGSHSVLDLGFEMCLRNISYSINRIFFR